jgi:general L-amino acid transport system substrate-binding protein
MYGAFFASRCLAVTEDSTALAAMLVRSGKAGDYKMLPDIISKEPLGPYVRAGDEAWFEIVRWTHYAMLEAEEYDIRQNNVDDKRQGHEGLVKRLLGVTQGNGKPLGLDEAWAYNIIKQVGNYDEIYERNVGAGSPLKFGRGLNALWSKGGLMYPLPLR